MQRTMQELVTFALARSGYFTAAEALELGVSRRMLAHHTAAGTFERLAYGIYRLELCPRHPLETLIVANLWAGQGSAISHFSALAVHRLGEAGPLVHITVPQPFRGKRDGVIVHHEVLQDHDLEMVDGIIVTSLERSLVDVAVADPERARAAARAAVEMGQSTIEDLERVLRARGQAVPEAPLPHAGSASSVGSVQREKTKTVPTPGGTFVGRSKELEELRLVMATSRLVTLTGPPGVGKSRLARELATRIDSHYPNGSFVAELSSVTDPDQVPQAVARVLTLWEQPGQSRADHITADLGTRRVLLVLDNCEHLLAACAHLAAQISAACPEVSILATSQEPLGLEIEQVVAVPPMGVPEAGTAVEDLAGFDSVQLFCWRAARVREGFQLDPEQAEAVAEICRRLDGIPLALELFAARVAMLTPVDIAARLGDRLALLTSDGAERPSRHQTMRAALDWTCGRLPPEERLLLHRLSVFAGGFGANAVEAVCSDAAPAKGAAAWVLDSLASLVAKSLVVVDTSDLRARYRLLEIIRIYAAEGLEDYGEAEAEAAQQRHVRYFLDLALAAAPELTGADQIEWLETLEANHDNLRSAMATCIEARQGVDAIALAGALGLFWRVRGHFSEGRRWCEAALALDSGHGRDRSAALLSVSLLSLLDGDKAACVARGDEGLALAREQDHRSSEARLLLVLGNARMWSEDDLAVRLLEEAAELSREAGDPWCLAHCLGLIGRLRLDGSDPTGARPLLEECVAIGRANRDAQSLRLGLFVYGDLEMQRGDYDRAAKLFGEDLDVARRLGDPLAVSLALSALGRLAHGKGDLSEAHAFHSEALTSARRSGSALSVVGALCGLGAVALEEGRMDQAEKYYTEAATLAEQAALNLGAPLTGLASVAIAMGHPSIGRRLFERALDVGRSGDDQLVGVVLFSFGQLDRVEGEPVRAAARHLEALRLRHRMEDLPQVADSLEALAGVGCDLGRFEQAARLFGAAQALRERGAYRRPPGLQRLHEADLQTATEKMGRKDLAAALAQGATMSPARAVAYAARGQGIKSRAATGWASLTNAELEVAALAADGLTSEEIGERLFSSTRTIGSHLSRIYAKLGITSRVQLTRQALYNRVGQDEGSPT